MSRTTENGMNDLFERVFIDDHYQPGGMHKRDLPEAKRNFRENAVKILNETNADHVAYCLIEYNSDGEITSAHFYNRLPMDDETFYERTRSIPGTDYIGAVHNHKPERCDEPCTNCGHCRPA